MSSTSKKNDFVIQCKSIGCQEDKHEQCPRYEKLESWPAKVVCSCSCHSRKKRVRVEESQDASIKSMLMPYCLAGVHEKCGLHWVNTKTGEREYECTCECHKDSVVQAATKTKTSEDAQKLTISMPSLHCRDDKHNECLIDYEHDFLPDWHCNCVCHQTTTTGDA